MIKTYGNLLVSGTILLIGLVLAVAAQYIDVGAAMAKGGDFMPKICADILLALGAILFAGDLLRLKRAPAAETAGAAAQPLNYRILFLNLLLIAAYFILLVPVGFVITTALYVTLQTYLFSPKAGRHRVICPLVGVASSAVIYYLFTYCFQLLLPYGILG